MQRLMWIQFSLENWNWSIGSVGMHFHLWWDKMVIKSKIKWVTLSLLTLSLLSLVAHLSVTKFSTIDLMQYSSMSGLHADFPNVVDKRVGFDQLLYDSVLLIHIYMYMHVFLGIDQCIWCGSFLFSFSFWQCYRLGIRRYGGSYSR